MFTSLRMDRKSVKTRKNRGLSLTNRAVLRAKTLKNERNLEKRVGSAIAARLKTPGFNPTTGKRYNPIVVPYNKRVKNTLAERKNKNTRHNKMINNIIPKLKKFNDKLKLGIKTYDAKINAGNISDDLMDAVSQFLDYIKISIEASNLHLEIEEENPADYVEKLTEFIDNNLIDNHMNAKNISSRIRTAKVLLNILNHSVKEHKEGAEQLGLMDTD